MAIRCIIQRTTIRSENKEVYACFKQIGRDRTLFKEFVAFRQIPEVIAEFNDANASVIDFDFFDVSYEFMEDYKEYLERFIN